MPVPERLAALLVLGLSGTVLAAADLPPLRVDPALLGPAPGRPRPMRSAPVASESAPDLAANLPSTEGRPAAGPADTPDGVAPAPQLLQPPVVAERPVLPPLYSAHAEAGALPESGLRPSIRLEPLPRDARIPYPVFVAASRIAGRGDNEVIAEGDVELRKANTSLSADRLTYWKIEDEVEALGNVRLTRDADFMSGPKLRLNLTETTGFFEQPKYSVTRAPQPPAPGQPPARVPPLAVVAGEVVSDTRGLVTGLGAAERLEFQGENRLRLINATYSTCPVEPPDWYAQAGEIKLDHDREVGEARDAKVVFKDVPLFYTPWLSFSLNNRRKSGFLTPTFGSSTRTGTELTVPFYWDIAPHMDATIAPRLMTKRGVQWNGEYRYLSHDYNGQMRGEWLPEDQILKKRRSGFTIVHNQHLGAGFAGSLNLNGVSDDTYFSDLGTRVTSAAQGNLLRQGVLAYGGAWWSAAANIQRYQTLQDPSLPPVAKPYERTPQLTLTAGRPLLRGDTWFAFNGEFVDFNHPTNVVGRRVTLYPQLAHTWQTPAWYLTPKLGFHATRYDLEKQAAGTPDNLSRRLPIVSLDSGVAFERDLDWFGGRLTQTLEPRLYYLYVPTRRQELIPNFDTGVNDFNFATIFSESAFSGGDRVADANQLTAALTSRLIDPQTGQEHLRGMLGQRYYFKDQEVTLPGVPARPGGAADLLAALSGRILPRTYADAGWQYNPRDRHTERLALGGRWQPDLTRVLNASYRFTRDGLVPGIRQIDVSGQWPLGRGWYGVGRYNFSLREDRLIESIGGVEYDGGCWVGRFVVQRFATGTGAANTAFFVQLELNGFSRIGSNPVEMLKRNIRGYGQINQPTADPAFGAN